jgi:hypothetical protein
MAKKRFPFEWTCVDSENLDFLVLSNIPFECDVREGFLSKKSEVFK